MNKTHNTQAGASREVEDTKFHDIEDSFNVRKKREEPAVEEKSRNNLIKYETSSEVFQSSKKAILFQPDKLHFEGKSQVKDYHEQESLNE